MDRHDEPARLAADPDDYARFKLVRTPIEGVGGQHAA